MRESSYELCGVSLTDVWLSAANANLTARAARKVRRFVDYTLRYIRNRFIFGLRPKVNGSKSLRFILLDLWISAFLVNLEIPH